MVVVINEVIFESVEEELRHFAGCKPWQKLRQRSAVS